MKKIHRRSIITLCLAGLLTAGLIWFIGDYIVNAGTWAVNRANPHTYSGGNLTCGTIYDSAGRLLSSESDGKRVYNDDETIREATLHAVGDSEGNIPGVQTAIADDLVGFDLVNGTYSLTGAGNTVYLTLDAEVCASALTALNGRKGTVGVYNYKTGEIICMVSSPTFDPTNVPDLTDSKYDGAYINRFLYSTYPPGSIFKVVTSAAAIENIPDILTQKFYCNGGTEIDGEEVKCDGVHNNIGFQDALAHSCNAAFANISLEVGPELLTKYAAKAIASLQFDGISTAAGNYDVSSAANVEVAWSGIGQYTDLINPCAYMAYLGAIANGGVQVLPHIIKKVENTAGITVATGKTRENGRIIDEATAETLTIMLHYNVVEIYGQSNYPGTYFCAKSGTAEVGGDAAPNATFTGYLKDEDYPLAFIVIVENGGSGSSVSGKIASTVLTEAMKVMDAEK